VREQRDAVRTNGGDNAFNFHELRVQAPVDQLVPVRLNRRWQLPGSQPGHPGGVHPGCKFTRIGNTLDFHQPPHFRPWAERWIPMINIDSRRMVLDHGSIENWVRQGTGNHTPDQDPLAFGSFFTGQLVNLFGVGQNRGRQRAGRVLFCRPAFNGNGPGQEQETDKDPLVKVGHTARHKLFRAWSITTLTQLPCGEKAFKPARRAAGLTVQLVKLGDMQIS
jgi:hypothetical protein